MKKRQVKKNLGKEDREMKQRRRSKEKGIRRWCNENNKQFNSNEKSSTAVSETRKKSDVVMEGWDDHCREPGFCLVVCVGRCDCLPSSLLWGVLSWRTSLSASFSVAFSLGHTLFPCWAWSCSRINTFQSLLMQVRPWLLAKWSRSDGSSSPYLSAGWWRFSTSRSGLPA